MVIKGMKSLGRHVRNTLTKYHEKLDARWPRSADKRLLRFMHEEDFYFIADRREKEDILLDLMYRLRKGTEIKFNMSVS
jgi:hypothetical protein